MKKPLNESEICWGPFTATYPCNCGGLMMPDYCDGTITTVGYCSGGTSSETNCDCCNQMGTSNVLKKKTPKRVSEYKLRQLIKKAIKEQEEIEPIGGPITQPNEFTYFDFKDWVWSDRKYYFREKTFKDNENMTLAQAVEENLLQDIFQMLTTLWETFIEETEVPMHGKIKDENRLKFGEELYEMMKEDNLLFKKDQ